MILNIYRLIYLARRDLIPIDFLLFAILTFLARQTSAYFFLFQANFHFLQWQNMQGRLWCLRRRQS